jgi:hypothetical protein
MRKEGFIYFNSGTLEQDIALSEKTGCLYCADKTVYTVSEQRLLADNGMEIFLAVHLVKKVFEGTIEEVENAGNKQDYKAGYLDIY